MNRSPPHATVDLCNLHARVPGDGCAIIRPGVAASEEPEMAAGRSAGGGNVRMERGFLGRLPPADHLDLEGRGRRRQFRRGEVLFHEGDPSHQALVILDGRAKISSFTEGGKEVLLGVRGVGELHGELSSVDGEARSATATALDPIQALVVPAEEFRAFLESHPRAAIAVVEIVGGRLRDSDRKRIEFAALDAVGRVARRLVELAEDYGEASADRVRIALPISQGELAGWTGASRESVSRALGTMRARGWIETHRRGVTVLALEALRRRAM